MTREELLKIAKPILFNTDMVRTILEERKTTTRRVIKLPKGREDFEFTGNIHLIIAGKHGEEYSYAECINQSVFPSVGSRYSVKCPYMKNDILYVRETWRVGAWDIRSQMIAFDYKDGTCGRLVHISDRELFERLINQSREDAQKAKCEYNGVDFIWEKGKSPCRWHPSIHMPKEAARIFLKVKDVRVERLQDIDDKGAYEEGAGEKDAIYYIGGRVCDFAKIWNSTIKKTDLDLYGWEANPWVWVIEFEKKEI